MSAGDGWSKKIRKCQGSGGLERWGYLPAEGEGDDPGDVTACGVWCSARLPARAAGWASLTRS
ncbi:hypothetical protein C6A85_02490, partial [Mycobacterium sp. ITM-2017-0098]